MFITDSDTDSDIIKKMEMDALTFDDFMDDSDIGVGELDYHADADLEELDSNPADILTTAELQRSADIIEALPMDKAQRLSPGYLAALLILSRYEDVQIKEHLDSYFAKLDM